VLFRRELERAGIVRLHPDFYLANEWGVPFPSISIGIPFYLAQPDLIAIHADRNGYMEGVSPTDLLRFLRHEMGHVVNYAYKLYEQEDWTRQFGSMMQPYTEEYRPQPFSRRYVRHLPGWYAQKHPDEDWAETFAVWMTPGWIGVRFTRIGRKRSRSSTIATGPWLSSRARSFADGHRSR